MVGGIPSTSDVLGRYQQERSVLCFPVEERCALADIDGVPSIAAGYRSHEPEAHVTIFFGASYPQLTLFGQCRMMNEEDCFLSSFSILHSSF